MSNNLLLELNGKLYKLIFKIPFVGETLVRSLSRAAAYLAFYAPLMGAKRHDSLSGIKEDWLQFLERAGISPRISREDSAELELLVSPCPYGFHQEQETGVCDACMDLDRVFVRLLGGELSLLETLPGGADACRILIRKS